MRRTLEILFRHPLQLLVLIILFPIIGFAVTYELVPKTYQSTASLWAWHRYEVLTATGAESDLNSTPAETQATALTELLDTQKFALEIVSGIDLAPTLHLSASVLNDPQQLNNALFQEVAKNVVATPEAYQLYTISYTNANPTIAQKVVLSVIRNFGQQSSGLSATDGQNLLANYQSQLEQAQKQQNADISAEDQYAASHSESAAELAVDPKYQQLDAAVKQDATTVSNIQNEINTIQQSMGANSTAGSLFQVQDQPQAPQLAQSRKTKFLMGAGVGLGVALIADAIYLIILVRRDRSIYSAYDLRDVVTLPVLMQLPALTPSSTVLLTSGEALP